jgi:hypothetical protein
MHGRNSWTFASFGSILESQWEKIPGSNQQPDSPMPPEKWTQRELQGQQTMCSKKQVVSRSMDTYGHCQAAHLMPSAPTLEAFQHADHLVEVHAQISWKFDMCWDVAGFLDQDVWENRRNQGILTMNRSFTFKSDQFGGSSHGSGLKMAQRYRRYQRSEVVVDVLWTI